MGMIKGTHTHQGHTQEKWLDTRRRLHNANQWEDHRSISNPYGRKYKRDMGELIINMVH